MFYRFMVGFNIGCVPQSVTLYAEFLPNKQRGKCVVLLDCFWALGAVLEVNNIDIKLRKVNTLQEISSVKEQVHYKGSRKKVLFLVARPLMPYPLPPRAF